MSIPANSTKRIMTVFGTRPEAIKMFPVVHALRAQPGIDARVCVAAQHRDLLDQVLDIAQIVPDVDLDVMLPNQALDALLARLVTGLGDTRRAAERKRVYLKADAIAVELDAKADIINVSETGMTGETDARIIVGEHVEISFSGRHYVPATVRWVHGRRFGLKLLAPPPFIGAADEDLTRDVRLFVGQTIRRAVVRNVSSTGLQIETDLPLHKGQQVLVKVLNGWSIMTRVAWVDGIRAGVSMDDPVALISFEKTA